MVVIKGMEGIPENCSDCDFCHGHICKRTGTDIVANPKGNCPLMFYEACQQLATATTMSMQEFIEKWDEVMRAVSKAITTVAESLAHTVAEFPDPPRTPEEIKKDIKYERNPMRLRQLNKELNESYKACKRKRGRKDGRTFRRI